MSLYEFSLKQEVLLEKGADVLGALMRYAAVNGVRSEDTKNPIMSMYSVAWEAKRDILLSHSEEELDKIDAQLDAAKKFCANIGAA